MSDALASVGVIVAGSLILLYDLYIADTIVTVMIASYVLYQGFSSLPRVINILMQATPPDIDRSEVISAIERIDGVENIHHVHIWEIDEHRRSLEAHVSTLSSEPSEQARVKSDIKDLLKRSFNIEHSTLEFEYCEQPSCSAPDQTVPLPSKGQ